MGKHWSHDRRAYRREIAKEALAVRGIAIALVMSGGIYAVGLIAWALLK